MLNRARTLVALAITTLLCVASVFASDSPDTGGHGPSQDAADLIRQHAATDGAFLAAGLVKESFDRGNLASLLQYPTDEIVVLELTGAQVRSAFERSVSLFPQPNQSFLQISGFEVVFRRSGPPNSRIVSIGVNGSSLEDAKTYTIAMPSSLARGGLGYFKIWDRTHIKRTIEGVTAETLLQGKPVVGSSSRWSPQS
jgi:2',3'-cyclic-nucleotide 2'-phosphodiesterase (5'-nucleotidase family)